MIPGGVNSPVRAFNAVGGEPFFAAGGEGAYISDSGGGRYLDLVCGYGPLILGHTPPVVVEAIRRQAGVGIGYGAPTEAETELAELVVKLVPGIEMLRLVTSGTEATMSATRLARGFTGRRLVAKFAGGYHGHADHLLAEAGSGAATLGIPASAGVPPEFAALTAVLPYNSVAAVEEFFAARGDELAAVIVEPVAGNMGVVEGRPEFLAMLRRQCTAHGALLVFDEVISGFRLGLGGAQATLGITPDLTCLGKVMGGGLPLAAYGGRAEVMTHVAPVGDVYQAGTLAGNPVAVAAGLATLGALVDNPPYDALDRAGAAIARGIESAAAKAGVDITINRVGSMLTPFLAPGPVVDYASARASDTRAYARLFHALLRAGVSVPPSQFEAWFVSLPLAESHLDEALAEIGGATETVFRR
ncbi:MAG: glutamate-semialdehyde -aminomutase [Chloroflexota bacterium]|nr:glutamate-semialdehyde -aminomutase [Chloroflexota bacterium]